MSCRWSFCSVWLYKNVFDHSHPLPFCLAQCCVLVSLIHIFSSLRTTLQLLTNISQCAESVLRWRKHWVVNCYIITNTLKPLKAQQWLFNKFRYVEKWFKLLPSTVGTYWTTTLTSTFFNDIVTIMVQNFVKIHDLCWNSASYLWRKT